jgi:hypothetical protein
MYWTNQEIRAAFSDFDDFLSSVKDPLQVAADSFVEAGDAARGFMTADMATAF